MRTKNAAEKAEVAVVVARFQVPALSEPHRELIQNALAHHDRVIIILGLAAITGRRNNPLDFESRKQMLTTEFREELDRLTILYIKDQPTHKGWNKELDRIIQDHVGDRSVVLYGGRGSFLDIYQGKFPTEELVSDRHISGTAIREQARRRAQNSPEFRAGVVYNAHQQYPTCFPTVDIALFSEDGARILLARKEAEHSYRFIGGFADPGSPSYEADAKREVQEETGVQVSEPTYVGSMLIDDWRYRSEVDKIKTLLFAATVLFGHPEANDDIAEVRWFDYAKLAESDLVYEHRPLLAMLRERHPRN